MEISLKIIHNSLWYPFTRCNWSDEFPCSSRWSCCFTWGRWFHCGRNCWALYFRRGSHISWAGCAECLCGSQGLDSVAAAKYLKNVVAGSYNLGRFSFDCHSTFWNAVWDSSISGCIFSPTLLAGAAAFLTVSSLIIADLTVGSSCQRIEASSEFLSKVDTSDNVDQR